MSYENAPGTAMVATCCACCGKPLLDATSVETGCGPECRKKHGYADAQAEPDWTRVAESLKVSPDPRVCANAIVHRIAVDQDGPRVPQLVATLHALGFQKMAERIAKRVGAIRVELDGDSYVVRTPYDPAHVERMRRVPGRRFEREEGKRGGHDRVPVSSRAQLWRALRESFPSMVAFGPHGAFTLPS